MPMLTCSQLVNVDLEGGPSSHVSLMGSVDRLMLIASQHGQLVNVESRDSRHDHDDHHHHHHHNHNHHYTRAQKAKNQPELAEVDSTVPSVRLNKREQQLDERLHHHHGHGDTYIHAHVHRRADTAVAVHDNLPTGRSVVTEGHPLKVNAHMHKRHDHRPVVVVDDGYRHHHHHHLTIINERSEIEARDHDHHNHHNHHHHSHRSVEERDECDDEADEDQAIMTVHDVKRAVGDTNGSPGYIDVTGTAFNSSSPTVIASLVLSTNNETETNSTFILNASTNMKTQMYLVPVASPSTPSTDGEIEVNLRLPVFVAASASTEDYCATFDRAPSSPAPLTVTPCHNETDTTDVHASQIFLYNPSTGVISPEWQGADDVSMVQSASVTSDDASDSADGDDEDMNDEAVGSDDGSDDVSADGDDTGDEDGGFDGDIDDQSDSASQSAMDMSMMPSSTMSDDAYASATMASMANMAFASDPASASFSASMDDYSVITASASASMPTATFTSTVNAAAEASASASPSDVESKGYNSARSSNITLIFSPSTPSTSSNDEDETQAMALDPYPEGDATRVSESASASTSGSTAPTMAPLEATSTFTLIYHSPTPESSHLSSTSASGSATASASTSSTAPSASATSAGSASLQMGKRSYPPRIAEKRDQYVIPGKSGMVPLESAQKSMQLRQNVKSLLSYFSVLR